MKNAVVTARIEQSVKQEAESILQSLGIPVSVLIDALYRQVIYKHSVPFSLSVPKTPVGIDGLSALELEEYLLEAYEESFHEEGIPAEEVFSNMKAMLKR